MDSSLNYSPKLKEAMAEIKAILTRHDIAGHVLLHEPSFSEFLLAIDPSWSILRIQGNNMIRVRSNLQEDYGGDVEAQHRDAVATANLVRHFADMLARDAGVFERLNAILGKHWQIEHGESVTTKDRPG